MTTLSEQEKEIKANAFEKLNDDGSLTVGEYKAFGKGFEAGLNYNKARLLELEAKVRELENKLASYVWMKD